MPLPLTVSCFGKIQIGFTFLVATHPGSPGKRAVKWVCVCVCVSGTGLPPGSPGKRAIKRVCVRVLTPIYCDCNVYHQFLMSCDMVHDIAAV